MSKKRMIIVTSVILSIVVISLGIVKLYQTYALGNYIDTVSSSTFNVTATKDTSVRVPANGYSNVFYMVTNTSPGTVKYGVAYTTDSSVAVKAFINSKDPASGLIEENGKKYVKLRLENTSSTVKNITLSTVLGYENGGDLIPPNGVTLVTKKYYINSTNSIAEYITNLYNNADKIPATNNGITYNYANIYDTDSDDNTSGGLMNDRLGGTTDDLDGGNIRYYGKNPNNYIYFNCETYPDTNCETWRIIGVFDGKLKLISGSKIGTYSWDNKNTDTGAESAFGKNDWATARLMKLLNPSDYYTVDVNDNGLGQSLYYNSASGKCYSGQNNATVDCDFASTGIKETTRGMIAETTYYLGGWNASSIYPNQMYGYERGTTVYSERPTTWPGKIALAYPSDYGYAVDFGKCEKVLYEYNDTVCVSNNWMYAISEASGNGWLLTSYSTASYGAFLVADSVGNVATNVVSKVYGITPVLYLNSELEIESGDGNGTSENPYKLSV